jgi:hypothetical protein
MLKVLHDRSPQIDDGATAIADGLAKTASTAIQSAKAASEQLDGWAHDGLDSIRTRPIMWGAASFGIGALMGGCIALWRRFKSSRIQRTVTARSRAQKLLRSKTNSGTSVPKKRVKKIAHPRSSAND